MLVLLILLGIPSPQKNTALAVTPPPAVTKPPVRISVIMKSPKSKTVKKTKTVTNVSDIVVKYAASLKPYQWYEFMKMMDCQFLILGADRSQILRFDPQTGTKVPLQKSDELYAAGLTGATRDNLKKDFADLVEQQAAQRGEKILVLVSPKYEQFLRDKHQNGLVILK